MTSEEGRVGEQLDVLVRVGCGRGHEAERHAVGAHALALSRRSSPANTAMDSRKVFVPPKPRRIAASSRLTATGAKASMSRMPSRTLS
jgi:hypothetical protein